MENEFEKVKVSRFKCGNCNGKSINKGYVYSGSHIRKWTSGEIRLCQKCEKEFLRQDEEDMQTYLLSIRTT